MSQKTLTKRRWELIPLVVALTLTLAVVAVPASAKGPLFVPYTGCAPATEDGIGTDRLPAPCQSGEAVTGRQGSDRAGRRHPRRNRRRVGAGDRRRDAGRNPPPGPPRKATGGPELRRQGSTPTNGDSDENQTPSGRRSSISAAGKRRGRIRRNVGRRNAPRTRMSGSRSSCTSKARRPRKPSTSISAMPSTAGETSTYSPTISPARARRSASTAASVASFGSKRTAEALSPANGVNSLPGGQIITAGLVSYGPDEEFKKDPYYAGITGGTASTGPPTVRSRSRSLARPRYFDSHSESSFYEEP